MGLIMKTLVVGGTLLALPSPPHSAQDDADQTANAEAWGYISAAVETVSDFKGFCERKPQVCVTAQYLAEGLEGKAKYNAKLIYEWANESTNEKPKLVKVPANLAKADPIRTGSADREVASAEVSGSTLRIEDLLPEWQGKKQPKKG